MLKPEIVLKMKEQFKAETMAYAAYDVIKDSIEDSYLKEALEEIMYDEFLHAKFLRSYMMECGVYDPTQHPDCEKAFNKMIED
jgi:rubrerythrin